ncbi:aspartate/glutamate racemase family protein [Candidatus Roizmanbacteria bacterium]|nr:aspartate/glutamate racemase family protein [Candidatus Roizmanbacteria bacterium]
MAKNKEKRPIVVFGGMGPQASVAMYDLLIRLASEEFGARDADEFPEILVDSIPVPDFIGGRIHKRALVTMIKQRMNKLSIFNPMCFSFACNTVHLFIEDFENDSEIPIISMIDEVVFLIKKKKRLKVGLLASPLTLQSRLYQSKFERENIEVFVPDNSQTKIVDAIIRNVIGGQRSTDDALRLISISDSLLDRGAQSIVLGCTELPLIFPKRFKVPTYDSLKILAKKLLHLYYKSDRYHG